VVSAFINATVVVGALHVGLDSAGTTVAADMIRRPGVA